MTPTIIAAIAITAALLLLAFVVFRSARVLADAIRLVAGQIAGMRRDRLGAALPPPPTQPTRPEQWPRAAEPLRDPPGPGSWTVHAGGTYPP